MKNSGNSVYCGVPFSRSRRKKVLRKACKCTSKGLQCGCSTERVLNIFETAFFKKNFRAYRDLSEYKNVSEYRTVSEYKNFTEYKKVSEYKNFSEYKISLNEKNSLNIKISLNLNIEFCTIWATTIFHPMKITNTSELHFKIF